MRFSLALVAVAPFRLGIVVVGVLPAAQSAAGSAIRGLRRVFLILSDFLPFVVLPRFDVHGLKLFVYLLLGLGWR